MNIAEAKKQVSNAMKAYFAKDEFGNYRIPPEGQRPVFLMGPPGIGKTAIMKQIADEMGVGLVSYSMTHHTRQSALGLPVITKKNYGGEVFSVTEYTMSEIIASVYDIMEESGVREGILFLDEINCVSETLTPTMLQFLQFKTFGKHSVPEGWIVVTAGNPPEYNRSAREFDIVTWDRLKRVDIEPDYSAWKEYALKKGVHPAVTTYLDARKENFYRVQADVDGKRFITARGWDDLSDMMKIYELQSVHVDKLLISQYIQDKEIAEDFAAYYDLFNKYRSDYRIGEILSGTEAEEIRERAKNAPFDERLSLIGLLLDTLRTDICSVMETEDYISELLPVLKNIKAGADLQEKLDEESARMNRDARRGALTPARRSTYERTLAFLADCVSEKADFPKMKARYDVELAGMRTAAAAAGGRLDCLFRFAETVWPEGQELLILVTELTTGWHTARFISRYGCERYYRHNKELMFYERNTEILKQIELMEEKKEKIDL